MISDAYRFLFPTLMLAAVSAWLGLPLIAASLVLLAAFICYFFRNPKRTIPAGEKLVVSPADGKVVKIAALSGQKGEPDGCVISIFLNIFDVHVNRTPIRGKLEELEYRRGRFKAAYDDAASSVNEQNILIIRGEGMRIVVKQIAGLIARRVVCWKKPGDQLERGEPIGLIRFGSRVDILLPKQVRIIVKMGDRVQGGSSIIGEYA